MSASFRCLFLLLLVALKGCASLESKRPIDDPWAKYAETRVQSGDYIEAARLFSDMAGKSGRPDYYRLRGADAYLRAGNNSAAQALMTSVDPNQLADADRTDYYLLSARLNLNVGRASQAMALLDQVAKSQRDSTQELHYHLLRASGYNQLGRMIESARERVKVLPLLTTSEAVQRNDEAIFDALNRLPDSVLKGQSPAPPDPLGGWMQLTQILRNDSGSDLGSELDEWRRRFPNHPADGPFLEEVLQQSGKQVEIKPAPAARAPTPPTSAPAVQAAGAPFIGVILPLSGSYLPAGEAIRAGMLAAFYADTGAEKLPLRFVDSQSAGVEKLYSGFATQGATLTVGPLLKEEVARVFQIPDRTIPILALNQIPDQTDPRIVQFGLTPEQEVEQAAGAAWFDGRHRAALLAPASSFGQRLVAHFTKYWRSLGGRVVTTKTYTANSTDYSKLAQELSTVLGVKPEGGGTTSPAEPPGAEFIFLVANVHDARLIKPQLDINGWSRLPIYATSHVFSGRPDAQQDRDLDGIYFCDIPWLLHSLDSGPLSSSGLSSEIDKTSADFVKLIALGIDAYRLAKEAPSMAAFPGHLFDGATGLLTLQSGNRVQRQLECAQFEGGIPQSRGLAPILRSSETERP